MKIYFSMRFTFARIIFSCHPLFSYLFSVHMRFEHCHIYNFLPISVCLVLSNIYVASVLFIHLSTYINIEIQDIYTYKFILYYAMGLAGLFCSSFEFHQDKAWNGMNAYVLFFHNVCIKIYLFEWFILI